LLFDFSLLPSHTVPFSRAIFIIYHHHVAANAYFTSISLKYKVMFIKLPVDKAREL